MAAAFEQIAPPVEKSRHNGSKRLRRVERRPLNRMFPLVVIGLWGYNLLKIMRLIYMKSVFV